MQRQQLSRTSSSDESNDSSLSRVLIHSSEQTSEHTLPLNISPSSTLITTTRRTIHTQTTQDIQSSFSSKSIPSFAETQLLSVYYPNKNPPNLSTNDKCIFVEQQDRQPIRYRITYDPLSSTKSTQTLPFSTPLSTHGSTLIIDGNQQINSNYNQYLKIHSGNQHLSNNFNDKYSLPNELIEESKYTYEEYIVHLNDKQNRTSSSSSSSVTTVIAQNEELDSHLTQSSTNTTSINNQRISSWPPVPDDILPIDENDEQKRSSNVQFAKQLGHVIPISTTNNLNKETITPPAIIPRTTINEKHELTDVNSHLVHEQSQKFDYYPINQSKWIKTHLDNSDIQINTTSNRVDTLRSLFEQQNNPIKQIKRIEPEEKPSKHGVEIRFRVNDPNISTIYHAEPAKIISHTKNSSIQEDQSISPFKLDQIRQITGKQLKTLDDIGHYLPDGYTWQWNEIFWLSLTTSQRDQLKDLEHQLYSRQNSFDHSINLNDSQLSSSSSNEVKRFKSTINITGAGAWQQNKPQTSSSGITKYSEINTIDETQPSISIFGTTPNTTYLRIDSQESIPSQQILTSNKRTDSQITIIESGYNSADDQQRFRPNSSTIIEESSTNYIDNINSSEQSKIDLLSYEQFIYDYLSTYAKHLRSNDGTLILIIDEQQINLSHIHLPLSNDNLILSKNIYIDLIDQYLLPFENELNQLIIFIYGESIILPTERWLFYKKKYNNAQWIHKLKKINQNIPSQLIPIIEQWIADHTTILLDTHQLNVDGLIIPLIGKLGLHLLDLYQIQPLQTNYWNDIYKYLIRIGYISYDSNKKLIYIANSELDIQYLLISFQLSEHLTNNINETDQTLKLNKNSINILIKWLENLNQEKLITITEQNDIIIFLNNQNQQIFINHEHIDKYMKINKKTKQIEIINMYDIANILLLFNYIKYSSGQFIFSNENIILNTNELIWLQSIIHSIQFIEHTQQTKIELFDGKNTQIIEIPYEYMLPTNNRQIIANYLFQNGNIHYDISTKNYEYHYKINHSLSKQKENLIKNYIEFINNHDGIKYDNKNNLLILNNPYDNSKLYLTNQHTKFIHNNQYKKQDMIYILNKYSQIKQDEFNNWLLYYNNQCIQISLLNHIDLLQETENEFLNRYYKTIDYMYINGLITCNKHLQNIQINFSNQILTIPINQLYSIINIKIYHSPNNDILPFDSYQLSQWLLNNSSQIINSSQGFIQLIYKNNLYNLPLIYPKLKLLFPFNKSLRSIQKTSSTTTLDIQQPNENNNYTIDPLLILANYIYRAGTIYQDELGRLVIKLNQYEIVIPRIEAINSIEAINISPKRTGSIITRLINRIGKIQSNNAGGLIITIGKSSFELSKEIIDHSNKLFIENEDFIFTNRQLNTSPILPLLKHSKSTSSLSSSTNKHQEFIDDQQMLYTKDGRGDARYLNLAYFNNQTSLDLKARILIIHDNEIISSLNHTIRFYIQYIYENDSNSIQTIEPQLIAPRHYRNIALREAPVYVYKQGEKEIYYENLAQYLSTEQSDLSSRTVRHMLKFSSRDEYFTYLSKKMSAIHAEQLVQESEEPLLYYTDIISKTSDEKENLIKDNNQQRPRSPGTYYNVKNGTTITESNIYEEQQHNHYNFSSKFIDQSPSLSSLNSDILITNTFPSHRTILGNVPISQYVTNYE